MNNIIQDQEYLMVMFTVAIMGTDISCLGVMPAIHKEPFNKPDTDPMQRFYFCTLVVDQDTGRVLKNSYGGKVQLS